MCHFSNLRVYEILHTLCFLVMRMNTVGKIIFWLIISLLIFLSLPECICGFVVYVVGKRNHQRMVFFDVSGEVVYLSLQLFRTRLTKITKEQCLSLMSLASFWVLVFSISTLRDTKFIYPIKKGFVIHHTYNLVWTSISVLVPLFLALVSLLYSNPELPIVA